MVARSTRWPLHSALTLPSSTSSYPVVVSLHLLRSDAICDTSNHPTRTCHRGNERLCFCVTPLRAPPATLAAASFLSASSVLLSAQPPRSCCWELVHFCSNEDLGRRVHFTLDSLQHPWYVSAFGAGAQAGPHGCTSVAGNRVQCGKTAAYVCSVCRLLENVTYTLEVGSTSHMLDMACVCTYSCRRADTKLRSEKLLGNWRSLICKSIVCWSLPKGRWWIIKCCNKYVYLVALA